MLVKVLKFVGKLVLDLLESAGIALSLFVIVYLFLFQPHQVKGSSMYPNFKSGEYILTNKLIYHLRDPQRGDVVVFKAPLNEDYDYIKRIVGLPGDRVALIDGQLRVNGELLPERYLADSIITFGGNYLAEGQEILVPSEFYFAVGDNRPQSSDSREWGPVPRANIIGLAWVRYWPIDQIGLVQAVEY